MSDAEEEQPKTITLQLKMTGEEPMFFKVKKETKFAKIFEAFAGRKGTSADAMRFMFDGEKLGGTDTPKMKEMEDNDMVDVVLEQQGGGEDGEPTLLLTVKDQTGDEMSFKVKKETKLGKIFRAYADSKGVDMASLRFSLDGERLNGENTPKMLELEDGDQIDVSLDMVGGR